MNVIVVVCNSVHLGFLGAYGNAWIETPNLDRLAAEGTVFEHHFPENNGWRQRTYRELEQRGQRGLVRCGLNEVKPNDGRSRNVAEHLR